MLYYVLSRTITSRLCSGVVSKMWKVCFLSKPFVWLVYKKYLSLCLNYNKLRLQPVYVCTSVPNELFLSFWASNQTMSVYTQTICFYTVTICFCNLKSCVYLNYLRMYLSYFWLLCNQMRLYCNYLCFTLASKSVTF